MYRNDYEVTGYYVSDGKDIDLVCPSCATQHEEEMADPIFLSTETPYVYYCSRCGEEIETSVYEE
jgi:uncharacterized Zn finger protein